MSSANTARLTKKSGGNAIIDIKQGKRDLESLWNLSEKEISFRNIMNVSRSGALI